MELTEQQKQEIKGKFSVRRKLQLSVSVPLIVMIFGFIFYEDWLKSGAGGISYDQAAIIFLVLVIDALVFSFWNWRCPACNKYLGRSINPMFCSKCGAPLQ